MIKKLQQVPKHHIFSCLPCYSLQICIIFLKLAWPLTFLSYQSLWWCYCYGHSISWVTVVNYKVCIGWVGFKSQGGIVHSNLRRQLNFVSTINFMHECTHFLQSHLNHECSRCYLSVGKDIVPMIVTPSHIPGVSTVVCGYIDIYAFKSLTSNTSNIKREN